MRSGYLKNLIYAFVAVLIISSSLTCVNTWAEDVMPISNTASVVEIRTANELVEARNIVGADSFILMADIDMSGIDWKPWDFTGKFDGNGHSILNLNVTSCSDETMVTYDGNRKEYDTYGAGFFGILKDATVSNLNLVGARIEVESDEHTFAAPIAGCCENAFISDCNISAYVSLTTPKIMWGVGGIVGYGSGALDNINTDVTLIAIDTDTVVKDEQFMGGAYGAGYLDITNCNIIIDGYDSDHGYVHNGGLVGMYIVYPLSNVSTYKGGIIDNSVTGKITFFEDNRDRRAYCVASVGEVMNWTYSYVGFRSDFKVDERKDYSKNLLPEECDKPAYTEVVTPATATDFGYTTYTCSGCNYSYKANYTIHEHVVDGLTMVEAATPETTGLDVGKCSLCNASVYFETKYVEPEVEEESTVAEKDEKKSSKGMTKSNMLKGIIIISAFVAVLIVILIVAQIVRVNQAKKRKRRRKRNRR